MRFSVDGRREVWREFREVKFLNASDGVFRGPFLGGRVGEVGFTFESCDGNDDCNDDFRKVSREGRSLTSSSSFTSDIISSTSLPPSCFLIKT